MYDESDRKYYLKNKDEILRKRKERHIKNRERDAIVSRKYREENGDKIRAYQAKYYKEHKTPEKERRHVAQVSWKERFIEMYGGECSCCGETVIEFLTIDHVQGQAGKKYRECSTRAYKHAAKEYRPDLFRVLCMNCNMAVRWGRICPHQIS